MVVRRSGLQIPWEGQTMTMAVDDGACTIVRRRTHARTDRQTRKMLAIKQVKRKE